VFTYASSIIYKTPLPGIYTEKLFHFHPLHEFQIISELKSYIEKKNGVKQNKSVFYNECKGR